LAASNLLALIDDIATILDDVAVMTKVAARKTAGVLGDDLALNAQQVAGIAPNRELPVVWSVAKGSIVNKLILVPTALLISAFTPWAVMPLLMLGGAFLCYEGFEKLAHKLMHSRDEDRVHHSELVEALQGHAADIVAFERTKIKGAIRTDFILSAEIIAITLGTVAEAQFATQVVVLTSIAMLMTAGVYGLVAGIVKLDDVGLHMSRAGGRNAARSVQRASGRAILLAAPYMMKAISILGTAAMFMVGGGILIHGIPGAEELVHEWAEIAGHAPAVGGALEWLATAVLGGVAGVIAGAIALACVSGTQRLIRLARSTRSNAAAASSTRRG
jgi:predicted DNA repair protein MutK